MSPRSALLAGMAAVLVTGVAGCALLGGNQESPVAPKPTSAPTTASPTPSVVVSTVVETQTQVVQVPGPTYTEYVYGGQPHNGHDPYTTLTHSCSELYSNDYAYYEVYDYWLWLGSPADMDDDSDGWPCETVYGDQNGDGK